MKEIEEALIYKPLIGKNIEIIESDNKNQIGLKGQILFESANIFYINTSQNTPNQKKESEIKEKTQTTQTAQETEKTTKIKKILKKNLIIKTDYKGKALNINCNLLISTIINRIKKIR